MSLVGAVQSRPCLFIFSDNVWFVDMDRHSLVPPYNESVDEAIASCSNLSGDCSTSRSGVGQNSLVLVQGRLRSCVDFWESELKASDFVLGIIRSGYRLPFIRTSPAVCMTNHRSALESAMFITNAIQELLHTNCIVECTECPLVCSPLQVVVSAAGKQRLVIDLRYINQYLRSSKFKYEGLNVLTSLFK